MKYIGLLALLMTVQMCLRGMENQANSPGTPAACQEVHLEKLISSGSEKVSLGKELTVEFPKDSFKIPHKVTLSLTCTQETQKDFEATLGVFGKAVRAPREIRINTGTVVPKRDLKVQTLVPAALLQQLPQAKRPQLFIQVWQAGGEEVLDQFMEFPSSFDFGQSILQASIPVSEAFTQERREDGSFESVLLVGYVEQ